MGFFSGLLNGESDKLDQRIRAGCMSFNRYWWELYDRPKVSLLDLKVQMVNVDVIQALLYDCGTWTTLKVHYGKLRTVHHRVLLRILGTAFCPTPMLSSGPDVRALRQVIASGVTVGQLRCFRAALFGLSLAPLKRRRLLQ